jgi:hypothetical protein
MFPIVTRATSRSNGTSARTVPRIRRCRCTRRSTSTRHPCVVWLQYPPGGRLHVFGGVMGSDLALEEFLPVVAEYRQEWFGTAALAPTVSRLDVRMLRSASFEHYARS